MTVTNGQLRMVAVLMRVVKYTTRVVALINDMFATTILLVVWIIVNTIVTINVVVKARVYQFIQM